MPVQVSYPGVYIEETPSASRNISGTSTSITAFIGCARRGPVNEPVRVQNFGGFERGFGGLFQDSSMSYAVQQYFLNGGGNAVIVRVHKGATSAKLEQKITGATKLKLQAANEGSWGNALRMRVNYEVSEETAQSYGLKKTDLFNLTVCDSSTGTTEEFRNLTIKESPRRIDGVLKSESQLVKVDAPIAGNTIPVAHGDPAAGQTFWNDDTASSKVLSTALGKDGNELTSTEYEGKQDEKCLVLI